MTTRFAAAHRIFLCLEAGSRFNKDISRSKHWNTEGSLVPTRACASFTSDLLHLIWDSGTPTPPEWACKAGIRSYTVMEMTLETSRFILIHTDDFDALTVHPARLTDRGRTSSGMRMQLVSYMTTRNRDCSSLQISKKHGHKMARCCC